MEGIFKDGFKGFINKGSHNQWQNDLNEDDIQKYKELASFYLDDKQLKWLETGEW